MPKLYPEFAYRGAALGDLRFRNNVVLADEVGRRLSVTNRIECYTTIARFTEDYLIQRNESGSVEGYAGPCWIDTLWFDVDDEDLENSLAGAYHLLMTLETAYQVDRADLRIYFSGKKGFHVGLPVRSFGAAPSPELPLALRFMATRIAESAGVTIDLSIYRTNSLLRLPNTINEKSGLFKIPLPLTGFEHLTVESVKALAHAVQPLPPAGPAGANERLGALYAQGMKDAATGEKKRLELPVLQNRESEMPRFDKVCMFRMLKGVPTGHRNEVCLRLADHFRKKGLPLSVTLAALLQWNRLNEAALEEVDVQDVINRVYDSQYDFGCHDPILDRYCHKECFLYEKKYPGGTAAESQILTIEEARARYQAYIRDRDQAKVSWGIDWLDQETRMIAPGQVACIMARAGVGKTALAITAIQKNSAAGVTSLFCTLEQLAEEIWERMAQNACEQSGQVIEDAFFASANADLMAHYAQATASAFENAYICDQDRLTVEQLKQVVAAAEVKAGRKIRLLVVDYLGRMKGEGRDQYQKISDLAIGLKEVAKACQLAVLVIVQVNRTGKAGHEEVTMDMARDSGQIEEAVDYAVGVWRLSEHETSSGVGYYRVVCQINKNRKGKTGVQEQFVFRPEVMRFERKDWKLPAADDSIWDPVTGECLGAR